MRRIRTHFGVRQLWRRFLLHGLLNFENAGGELCQWSLHSSPRRRLPHGHLLRRRIWKSYTLRWWLLLWQQKNNFIGHLKAVCCWLLLFEWVYFSYTQRCFQHLNELNKWWHRWYLSVRSVLRLTILCTLLVQCRYFYLLPGCSVLSRMYTLYRWTVLRYNFDAKPSRFMHCRVLLRCWKHFRDPSPLRLRFILSSGHCDYEDMPTRSVYSGNREPNLPNLPRWSNLPRYRNNHTMS